VLTGASLLSVAADGRGEETTAIVSISSVFKVNTVFHVGQTLSYNVYVFDSGTRKEYPGTAAVQVSLVNGTRTVSVPVSAYKPYFFTGTVKIPRGLQGKAYLRATVTAGRTFSVVSKQIIISGPAKAVEIGKPTTVKGAAASGTLTGTILRPANSYVFASTTSSPSQPVSFSWKVHCRRGALTSTGGGSGNDGGPGSVTGDLIIKKVPLTIQHADSCTISFFAQLSGSGSLKIEMLGEQRTA
jgi:hypothetical protein